MGHSLCRGLLADQGAARVSRSGSIRWAGLDGRRALAAIGDKSGIDRYSQAARTETSSTSKPEERHGGGWWSGEWDEVVIVWREVLVVQSQSAGHGTPERGLAPLVHPTTRFPAKGSLPSASSFVLRSLALRITVSHSTGCHLVPDAISIDCDQILTPLQSRQDELHRPPRSLDLDPSQGKNTSIMRHS